MKHYVANIEEAINLFENELPDPFISNASTIKEYFFIDDRKILLEAQKTKGPSGIRWNVISNTEISHLIS